MRRIETIQDAMRCTLIYIPAYATLHSKSVVGDLSVMVSSKGIRTIASVERTRKGTEEFMQRNEIWDVSGSRLCYILFY